MSQSNHLALSLAHTMETIASKGTGIRLDEAWSHVLNSAPNSPDLYLGITVMYGRFVELDERIKDSTLSDRAKGLYSGAVLQLAQFANPAMLHQFTAGNVEQHKDKIDLLHLAADSLPTGLVADVQPATLEQLCAELDAIRKSVADAEVEPEVRRLIETSLNTLLMILRSYGMFGPEGAARIYGSVAAELARNLQQVSPKSKAANSLLQRTVSFTKKVGAVVIWTSALAGGVENLITDGSEIAAMLTGGESEGTVSNSTAVKAEPKKR